MLITKNVFVASTLIRVSIKSGSGQLMREVLSKHQYVNIAIVVAAREIALMENFNAINSN